MVLMMGMFGTAQSSLLSFPEERPVFLREFSTDHYAAFTYFLARLTTEAVVTFIQILLTVSALCDGSRRRPVCIACLTTRLYYLGLYYVLDDWFSVQLWYPPGDLLYSCNGEYRSCCIARLFCGGSKAWTRDASDSVCTTDAVCWILCHAGSHSHLASLGTVSLFIDIRCSSFPRGRIWQLWP